MILGLSLGDSMNEATKEGRSSGPCGCGEVWVSGGMRPPWLGSHLPGRRDLAGASSLRGPLCRVGSTPSTPEAALCPCWQNNQPGCPPGPSGLRRKRRPGTRTSHHAWTTGRAQGPIAENPPCVSTLDPQPPGAPWGPLRWVEGTCPTRSPLKWLSPPKWVFSLGCKPICITLSFNYGCPSKNYVVKPKLRLT